MRILAGWNHSETTFLDDFRGDFWTHRVNLETWQPRKVRPIDENRDSTAPKTTRYSRRELSYRVEPLSPCHRYLELAHDLTVVEFETSSLCRCLSIHEMLFWPCIGFKLVTSSATHQARIVESQDSTLIAAWRLHPRRCQSCSDEILSRLHVLILPTTTLRMWRLTKVLGAF